MLSGSEVKTVASEGSLGEKIAELRKERRWTQQVFAEKIGVHPNHITRWESNRFRPSSEMLQKIAEVFEVRLDDLLDPKLNLPQALAEDKQLLERLELLRELEPDERAVIFHIIDTYATQRRLVKLLGAKPVAQSTR